jgi:predicted enzyme related to lactoylglutathione lyase
METSIKRVLFNILAKDLATSVAFYQHLAGFAPIYTSSWYIVLTVPGSETIELGLIDEVSQFAPRHAWGTMQGTYLTLVVNDVFEAVARARELGVEIIDEPRALEYGHTRALIRDPNGLVIDLSTPTSELHGRSAAELAPTVKNTAIDQQQPEENHQHPENMRR